MVCHVRCKWDSDKAYLNSAKCIYLFSYLLWGVTHDWLIFCTLVIGSLYWFLNSTNPLTALTYLLPAVFFLRTAHGHSWIIYFATVIVISVVLYCIRLGVVLLWWHIPKFHLYILIIRIQIIWFCLMPSEKTNHIADRLGWHSRNIGTRPDKWDVFSHRLDCQPLAIWAVDDIRYMGLCKLQNKSNTFYKYKYKTNFPALT